MPIILYIPQCRTHGLDLCQAGLRSDSGPAGEAAISLTMEFPLLSSSIHDAATYGKQIPNNITTQTLMCLAEKLFFFLKPISFNIIFMLRSQGQSATGTDVFSRLRYSPWYESCKAPNIVHLRRTFCIRLVQMLCRNIWIMWGSWSSAGGL